MMKLVCPTALSCDTLSEGTTDWRSMRSRICARSTVSAPVTETEIGTSWSVCSRFVAVTMMSPLSASAFCA